MQRRRTDSMFLENWPAVPAWSASPLRLPPLAQDPQGGSTAMPPRRILRAYVEQIDFEILCHLRMPSYLLPALLFPALIYGMFLHAHGASQDSGDAAFWLADYASFAAIVPGLYLFAVAAATDDAGAYAVLQHVLPVPAGAALTAKLVLAALTAALGVSILLAMTWAMGGTTPDMGSAVTLVATAAACTLPFCGLGMLIGSLAGRTGAIICVNLVLMPLVFLSGLLLPQQLLPDTLRTLAIFSPGHDVLILALSALRPDLPAPAWHFAYLFLFALVLGVFAYWRQQLNAQLRRD